MTKSNRRSFIKASGVTGVVALTGLAGCGGNGGNGSSGNSGSSSSSSGGQTSSGSSKPIILAADVPLSGPFASVGKDLKWGYELGVDRMNNNGILDREVKLLVKDDKTDPKQVHSNLTQMLSNNDVDLVLSSFADLLIANEVPIVEKHGVPLLAVAQSNAKLHNENNTDWFYSPFPMSSDHVKSTKALLDSIPASKRPSKVGIWVPNDAWSLTMADGWEKVLKSDYDVVLREKHSETAKDFSTLISKTKSAGVEALLGTPTPATGITAQKQLNGADYTPKFQQFVRAADTRAWTTALGKAGTDVCNSSGWVPGLTGNGNSDMVSNFYKKYPKYPSGNTLPVMTGAAYNSTQVAEQAFKKAGSTDKKEVQAALRSTTFNTVCGSFSFNDRGIPQGFTAPIGQWQNSNQHLVYPNSDGKQARDLVYPIQ